MRLLPLSRKLTLSENEYRYLDLLKKCLSDSIYDDGLDLMQGMFVMDEQTGKVHSSDAPRATAERKRLGAIWPSRAHTMIGMARLDNLQACIETIIKDRVGGDLIETGVWRGGASIFMRGVLKAFGVADRKVWVADSFEGLPPPNAELYPQDSEDTLHRFADLAVSLEEVRRNFERYGLLDEQVSFLKGWFRDTLPSAPIERLALMRLDGDMYESTMDALVHLYPKLQIGGFVIIDDWNAVPACNGAVGEFRRATRITAKLMLIEGCGAFWRKTAD
jgi:O-methyltransferase